MKAVLTAIVWLLGGCLIGLVFGVLVLAGPTIGAGTGIALAAGATYGGARYYVLRRP